MTTHEAVRFIQTDKFYQIMRHQEKTVPYFWHEATDVIRDSILGRDQDSIQILLHEFERLTLLEEEKLATVQEIQAAKILLAAFCKFDTSEEADVLRRSTGIQLQEGLR